MDVACAVPAHATATPAGRGFCPAFDQGGGWLPFQVVQEVGLALLEELVPVDPDHAFFADLFKIVEVELADQRLKAGVAEVLGQHFVLETDGVFHVEGETICAICAGRGRASGSSEEKDHGQNLRVLRGPSKISWIGLDACSRSISSHAAKIAFMCGGRGREGS